MVIGNKGKISFGIVDKAIIAIIALVLVLNVLAVTVPLAQDSGDELGNEAICESLGCFYNESVTAECLVSSGIQNETCAGDYEGSKIPLSSFFSPGGLVFIIIMAGFLILIVRSYLSKKK